MSDDNEWARYYQAVQGRAPRQLVLSALSAFEAVNFAVDDAQAIDLGCGDGTETLALLAKGWQVRTTMTFLKAAAVHQLFDGFQVGYFREYEDDWATALGEMKHWHVIEVVAHLPENQPKKD